MTRVAVYCQIDMEPLTIIDVPPEVINNWEAKSRWEGRLAWPKPVEVKTDDNLKIGTMPHVVQVNVTAWKYRFNAAYGWFLMVDNRDFSEALKGDALTVNCMPEQAPGRHDMAMVKLMNIVVVEAMPK